MDVILTWKKPPLILVGLFFAKRETLCIQCFPVALKVPVKFLMIMNTGPRAPRVSHFSVSAWEGKDQVRQQHLNFTSSPKGIVLGGGCSMFLPAAPAWAHRRPLRAVISQVLHSSCFSGALVCCLSSTKLWGTCSRISSTNDCWDLWWSYQLLNTCSTMQQYSTMNVEGQTGTKTLFYPHFSEMSATKCWWFYCLKSLDATTLAQCLYKRVLQREFMFWFGFYLFLCDQRQDLRRKYFHLFHCP